MQRDLAAQQLESTVMISSAAAFLAANADALPELRAAAPTSANAARAVGLYMLTLDTWQRRN
jgi:hypothetical protein